MSMPRLLSGFFCRLILIYGLLIVPWPGLREGYSTAYRAVGNVLFGSFGSDGLVRFEPLPDDKSRDDTMIVIKNRRVPGGQVSHPHNTQLRAYLPTATAVALILATPIPWRRRWKAALLGWMLINGVVAMRMLIVLLYGFSRDHPCALYSPGPFWDGVVVALWNIFDVWIGFAFVAPIFVWIVVTFRRGDMEQWLAPTPGKRKPRNQTSDKAGRRAPGTSKPRDKA